MVVLSGMFATYADGPACGKGKPTYIEHAGMDECIGLCPLSSSIMGWMSM